MKTAKFLNLLIFVVLFFSNPASANMLVDRIIVDFLPGSSFRQDVGITNPSDEPLYIQVEVLEVTNPGTEDERRELVRDPETLGFIATPNRLTIPARGRRSVRLVNLDGHGDTEQVYRVNLKPVSPPFETDTSVIRIMVGYQLLVFIAPQSPDSNLEWSRQGADLQLKNVGNTNIHLSSGEQCWQQESERECADLPTRRLYPGNKMSLEIHPDADVSYRVESLGRPERRFFN